MHKHSPGFPNQCQDEMHNALQTAVSSGHEDLMHLLVRYMRDVGMEVRLDLNLIPKLLDVSPHMLRYLSRCRWVTPPTSVLTRIEEAYREGRREWARAMYDCFASHDRKKRKLHRADMTPEYNAALLRFAAPTL